MQGKTVRWQPPKLECRNHCRCRCYTKLQGLPPDVLHSLKASAWDAYEPHGRWARCQVFTRTLQCNIFTIATTPALIPTATIKKFHVKTCLRYTCSGETVQTSETLDDLILNLIMIGGVEMHVLYWVLWPYIKWVTFRSVPRPQGTNCKLAQESITLYCKWGQPLWKGRLEQRRRP